MLRTPDAAAPARPALVADRRARFGDRPAPGVLNITQTYGTVNKISATATLRADLLAAFLR